MNSKTNDFNRKNFRQLPDFNRSRHRYYTRTYWNIPSKCIKCIEYDLEKSLLRTVKIKQVEDISQGLLKQSNNLGLMARLVTR